MENYIDNSSHFSEEVQDIINRPPGWFALWGITAMTIAFVVLLFVSWFISYPDVLHANVILTTNPAPLNLFSRNSGPIEIFRKENDWVKKGDLIAMIKTNGNCNDLLDLEKKLASSISAGGLQQLSSHYQLGELQPYLNNLILSEKELEIFRSNNLQHRQIAQLRRQIDQQQKLTINFNEQLKLMINELVLSKEKFESDSVLYSQKVLARIDFNTSKSRHLQFLRSVKNAESVIINNEREIAQGEKQIMELSAESISSENQFRFAYERNISELYSQIKRWKENYLFISPLEGRLSYLEFLEQGQYIESGKELFSVVPASDNIFGIAELPVDGSGKLTEGQQVNIRLQNYPYEQFGMLRGRIESVSLMPSQGKYILRISLPSGMMSSHQKLLPFQQRLQGDAEIITEDLKLLERLFYQLIKIARQ